MIKFCGRLIERVAIELAGQISWIWRLSNKFSYSLPLRIFTPTFVCSLRENHKEQLQRERERERKRELKLGKP